MGQFGPISTTALLQIGQVGLKKPQPKLQKPQESTATH